MLVAADAPNSSTSRVEIFFSQRNRERGGPSNHIPLHSPVDWREAAVRSARTNSNTIVTITTAGNQF